VKVIRHKLTGTLEENIGTVAQVLKKQLTTGISSIEVRELAEEIIKNVPARDKAGEIKAIHKWCVGHLRFTGDPYQIELLESPRRLVEKYRKTGKIMVDCDSIAPLEASLLGTVGHRASVVLIDANPLHRDYSHVIGQVWYGGRWVSLDPIADGKIGFAPKHTKELRIEANHG